MRQTTFGGRYVTAEDVARCVEAFNTCIHGGARQGANTGPPLATSSGNAESGLPQHFSIKSDAVAVDCRRSGETIACEETLTVPYGTTDTSTATVTGTLSGLTMTGTTKGHQTGHAPADPSCRYEQDFSGPATYVFSLDGTVSLRYGAPKIQGTYSCEGETPTSFTGQAWESTGTWRAVE